MIPRIIPPLTGASVLVTRPQPQADVLAKSIAALGGEPIVFPTIAIEPLTAPPPQSHDWVIFASVHAVEHGAALIPRDATTRIVAIGKATANALAAANLPADVIANPPYTSEALLAQDDFQPAPGQSVLIVRGAGGRELLRETLIARGAHVGIFEVYRRVRPAVPQTEIEALEKRWEETPIDAVTATSVETYRNLVELLSPRGRELLNDTPLLAPSQRIVDAAAATGWRGQALITCGADDAAIVGTLARWLTRARCS
jgi:uroporphyrinogen-III synthase